MSDDGATGRPLSDEERARAMMEQLKSVHAFDLAYEMMIGLVSFAYQKMGLTAETRPARDLGDARQAIDLLKANLDVVEREHGGERTRDVRGALAQMQLAYAQAVRDSGGPGASAPAEPAAAAAEPVEDAKPAEDAEPAAPQEPADEKAEAADAAPEESAAAKATPKRVAPKRSAPRKPAKKKPAPKKKPDAG